MPSRPRCRMDALLAVIGDQWTLAIIHKLTAGPWRTLELHSSFKGMSTKTLASRLNLLSKNGIVSRKSYPERPPRVEYSLTDKGRELLPVLEAIASLAADWYGVSSADQASEACRACLADVRRSAASESRRQTKAGAQPPEEPIQRPRPKKRNDVTLL